MRYWEAVEKLSNSEGTEKEAFTLQQFKMVGAVGFELEALSRRKRAAAGDEREPAAEMPSGARHLALSPLRGSDGGRCRIRTYDFHRVKMALYR